MAPKHLIHASFHKCLTKYYIKVMHLLYNRLHPLRPGHQHVEAIEDRFYDSYRDFRVTSTNGFAIDLDALDDDCRVSRFVRDPRDLLVSGYFYHRRGAEGWFRHVDPDEEFWSPINGHVPPDMPEGMSFADYLQSLDKEAGLIAEMQFRKYHFESLRAWKPDPRVRIFRYEEIVGNEAAAFDEIFRFYEVPAWERFVGVSLAKRYRSSKRARWTGHIRDPRAGQWREHFTPGVEREFNALYGDVLEELGY